MSERNTADFPIPRPMRMNEAVTIDDTISHIDVMLPYAQESVDEGFRFVNLLWKPLRINRIDERSLVLNDLSGLEVTRGQALPDESIEEAPFDVMDIYGGAERTFGRDPSANLARLAILDTVYMSRRHFSITAHFGDRGLTLFFRDLGSKNGSELRVHRKRETAADTATESVALRTV